MRDTFPRINWPYISFFALMGTGGLVFIGWAVTAQVYREWSHGLPISGGWSWPSVFLVDLVCALFVCALNWEIYCDAKTTIDENGIYQPSLFGMRAISWAEVTNVEVFGGVGYRVYAGKRKIVIAPYTYKNPDDVIESLRVNIQEAKRGIT